MTTDNFTEAARAEAGRRWPAYPTVGFSGAGDRQVPFIEGACWARTHLAAQEPTDAEVLAALNAHDPTASTPNLGHHAPSHVGAMRAALSAARAARRDEEKRASCGCDLTGMAPPAAHIVDRHEAGR